MQLGRRDADERRLRAPFVRKLRGPLPRPAPGRVGNPTAQVSNESRRSARDFPVPATGGRKARGQCDQALYGTATRETEARSTQPQKDGCRLLLAAARAGYGPSPLQLTSSGQAIHRYAGPCPPPSSLPSCADNRGSLCQKWYVRTLPNGG